VYEKDVKTTFPPTHRLFIGLICALTLISGGLQAASPPLVSVTASPSIVDRETLQSAFFTIHLSAPASHNIGVVFYMTGTARLGFDYVLSGNFVGGQIVIPAGQTSTTITLSPIRLDARFIRENALINLLHDTRVPHTYALGSAVKANVILLVE
jgi:hypothetical protein